MSVTLGQYLSLGQSAEAVHATETPDINIDTAAMFTRYAPWVPQDNDKTTSRTYATEAHRQYLKLVHHIPLAIDPSNFENAIKSIYALVRTADAYDSLTVVSMPVENFLIRNHSLDLENLSGTMYKELVDIAMKIRSHWLLKEIGCRIIADPRWDDHDIERSLYSTGAGELLLSKRAELRDLLKEIDQRVVIILPGKFGRMLDKSTITFATAAFRDEISRLFNSHKKSDWISYARKFRLLEERLSQRHYPGIHGLYEKFGKPANIESFFFERVFRSLQDRTAEIIKPLFECVVKQPSAKLNKRDASYQGFLCIDLTEDDMPWKEDRHSTSTREREEEG